MRSYEIGLVQWYDGSAKEIIGPFDTREGASDECSRRNKELGVKQPGRGEWGWMVAYWEEIPRRPECKVSAPILVIEN